MKTFVRAIVRAIVRVLVTLLVIAVVLIVAVAAAYRFYLPDWVDQQIHAEMNRRGLTNATYTLQHVTVDQTRLTDISLGEGLSVEAITINYRWQPLLSSRRAAAVTITGLDYTIDVTDGKIDLGPLAPLLADAGPAGALPIDDLRFDDCAITIRNGEQTRRIPIAADGVLAYDKQRRAVVIDLAMKPGETDHLIARLFETFTGYTIDGEVGVAGQISVDGGAVAITGTFRQTTIANADAGQRFEGVVGQITLDAFSPHTPNSQHIGWTSARIGELDLGAGSVLFQLTEGPALHVERLQWRIGAGRYWAHAFVIRPDEPDMKINLFWENVELNDWLAIVAAEKATGSGRLYGRLPIRIRTQPRLNLTFGEGYLIARGSGHVTIEDKQLVEQMVYKHAGQIGGEGDIGAQVQDRVTQSLHDFQYETLSFVVEVEDGEPVLRVTTAGKGRTVPQELNLEVNFRGIGPLVDLLLRTKLGMDRAADTMLRESFGLE